MRPLSFRIPCMFMMSFLSILPPATGGAHDQNRLPGQWVADLDNDDYQRREEATLALIKMGSPAIPLLQEAIGHPPSEVTWRATTILEQIGFRGDDATTLAVLRCMLELSKQGHHEFDEIAVRLQQKWKANRTQHAISMFQRLGGIIFDQPAYVEGFAGAGGRFRVVMGGAPVFLGGGDIIIKPPIADAPQVAFDISGVKILSEKDLLSDADVDRLIEDHIAINGPDSPDQELHDSATAVPVANGTEYVDPLPPTVRIGPAPPRRARIADLADGAKEIDEEKRMAPRLAPAAMVPARTVIAPAPHAAGPAPAAVPLPVPAPVAATLPVPAAVPRDKRFAVLPPVDPDAVPKATLEVPATRVAPEPGPPVASAPESTEPVPAGEVRALPSPYYLLDEPSGVKADDKDDDLVLLTEDAVIGVDLDVAQPADDADEDELAEAMEAELPDGAMWAIVEDGMEIEMEAMDIDIVAMPLAGPIAIADFAPAVAFDGQAMTGATPRRSASFNKTWKGGAEGLKLLHQIDGLHSIQIQELNVTTEMMDQLVNVSTLASLTLHKCKFDKDQVLKLMNERPELTIQVVGDAYLGITSGDPSGLGDSGCVISSVYSKSSAASAGLTPGDNIVEIDGGKIPNFRALAMVIASMDAGQEIDIKVLRNETQELNLKAVLGNRAEIEGESVMEEEAILPSVGITFPEDLPVAPAPIPITPRR